MTEEFVKDGIHVKHHEMRPVAEATLYSYAATHTKRVLLDITYDTMMEVGTRISGGTKPVGVDALSLQKYLLHFGEAISELQLIFPSITELLENDDCPADWTG